MEPSAPLTTSDFDYELPPELIAQRPVARGESRLLVLPAAGRLRHLNVRELVGVLRPGDLMVVNDTRVIPARLHGRRAPEGGRVELLLLEPLADEGWEVLARPARRLRPGSRVAIDGGPELEVIEKRVGGRLAVRFERPVEEWLAAAGEVPLPPYIHRAPDPEDRERYQTLFARASGAVAAPTAGLHFDRELLAELQERGVERATVTLHVGLGTFKPIDTAKLGDHRMEEERFAVPPGTVEALRRTRARGGRVVAVGTTVVRALESAVGPAGELRAGAGRTGLFIVPGHRFRIPDLLLTNFHLPRSTLLALVAAFAGRRRVLAAYRAAVAARYRFYSYGDAMLVERRTGVAGRPAGGTFSLGDHPRE